MKVCLPCPNLAYYSLPYGAFSQYLWLDYAITVLAVVAPACVSVAAKLCKVPLNVFRMKRALYKSLYK